MDNDDLPVGRVLTRREALVLFGAAGATLLAACSSNSDDDPAPTATGTASGSGGSPATSAQAAQQSTAAETTTTQAASTATTAPAETATTGAASATEQTTTVAEATITTLPQCVVVPELTEGPYFVDEQLDRSDIRSDPSDGSMRDGAPLLLTFRVSHISGQGCVAYAGAVVDVWHCDALGVYSDVSDGGFNTVGQQFLRGYQVTDENGIATFTSIYPGWYQGRTVHIHFKVRSEPTENSSLEFTSQLFFDDAFSDEVFLAEPYADKGERGTRNDDDGIFQESDDLLILNCTTTTDGYAATFDIGIQAS